MNSRTNLVIAEVIKRVIIAHLGTRINLYSAIADAQKVQLENDVLDFGILMNPTDKHK